MLSQLIAIAVAAEPVIVVGPFDVDGAAPELGLALRSILEDAATYVSARYPPELVSAWGKALKAGTPQAAAEVAAKWPDFAPAKRRARK